MLLISKEINQEDLKMLGIQETLILIGLGFVYKIIKQLVARMNGVNIGRIETKRFLIDGIEISMKPKNSKKDERKFLS
jgi:hypothetical protein